MPNSGIPKQRYLTKSRFQLARQCPTKLYYTGKAEYANKKLDDLFLRTLAEGGFQVGELAKRYFPGGHDVTSLAYEEAESQTRRHLEPEDAVVFEAAIRHENLFVRVDVLTKSGSELELIEVKAKSFDHLEESPFLKKSGALRPTWRPYLYDVAFQTYVLRSAMPGSTVRPYLMMIDKHACCPTDGLHQKFRIVRDANNHRGVEVSSQLLPEDLEPQLLIKIAVDGIVEMILEGNDPEGPDDFAAEVERLSRAYESDRKLTSPLTSKCGSCEFSTPDEAPAKGRRSGVRECWSEALGWTDEDFEQQSVLCLWNYRQKDARIADGRIKLNDLRESDVGANKPAKSGLSTSERQWLQIEKARDHDSTPYLDVEGFASEQTSWIHPLHFVDFETAMVALPFHKGRRPYEGIAFQFSHHVVHESGAVEHAGEYLNTERGAFPNYEFTRALREQLGSDDGTIFRYGHHENTFLCAIHEQLGADPHPPKDRDELMRFIREISRSGAGNDEQWHGERAMVDMLELVKNYYYQADMRGSNSLKVVLPAMLNSSPYLEQRYSAPIYGAEGGIRSQNYRDWTWVRRDQGQVVDPYRLLPKLFRDVSEEAQEILFADEELREGGAAMAAYSRAQFAEMTERERQRVFEALLKYCELDTLAMVMLYEGWMDLMDQRSTSG